MKISKGMARWLTSRKRWFSRHLHRHRSIPYGGYRIGIKCPAPLKPGEAQWGDYYFAHALRRALEAQGHAARVDLRPDWYSSVAPGDDAVIVLRGREKYEPVPSQTNLLWLISHPDEASDSELETFDHVFVASESYAIALASRLAIPVSPLLQCSDPEIFHPPAPSSDAPLTAILFVGNTRGEMRHVIADAIAENLPVTIYGHGWAKFLPPDWIAGRHIPNERLHEHYGRAKIVLNDQWPDMEREGFISNRIFDVALSGGFVISRDFKGSEFFEGDLVTYYACKELRKLCDYWLGADAQRQITAERLRQRVLTSCTFSHRASALIAVINAFQASRVTAFG